MKKIFFLFFMFIFTQMVYSEEMRDYLSQGDAFYKNRALGQIEGKALAENIDQAISAYQKALAIKPDSPEAARKLLRSYYFKGSFTTENNKER